MPSPRRRPRTFAPVPPAGASASAVWQACQVQVIELRCDQPFLRSSLVWIGARDKTAGVVGLKYVCEWLTQRSKYEIRL